MTVIRTSFQNKLKINRMMLFCNLFMEPTYSLGFVKIKGSFDHDQCLHPLENYLSYRLSLAFTKSVQNLKCIASFISEMDLVLKIEKGHMILTMLHLVWFSILRLVTIELCRFTHYKDKRAIQSLQNG